jgi:imidazoleglycerol-phosphate dehydratase
LAATDALPTEVTRETRETRVRVVLNASAPGLAVPVGFFRHMLTAAATTWGLPLTVEAAGDTDVDPHHLVEDVGIVLGQALREAWPGYAGLARYGWAVVAMDEARSAAALDLSGRTGAWVAGMPEQPVAGLDSEVLVEFFHGLARGGTLTVHITGEAGVNRHHRWEAAFKALGLALRMATSPRGDGPLSSKGVLG